MSSIFLAKYHVGRFVKKIEGILMYAVSEKDKRYAKS